MAAKTDWKSGDVITSAELNNMGTLINTKAAKGDKGDKGATGAALKAVEFTKDADGKITGGTATLTDGSTVAITVK